MKISDITIPRYSFSEELINSISHGIGAIFSIGALVLLVSRANSEAARIACTVFGCCMITLYMFSCFYHGIPARYDAKKVFRIIDHCNVYLLVYGTFVPMLLVAVGGKLGWIVFSIITMDTALGITLSIIDFNRFHFMEVIIHLCNGWSALLYAKVIYDRIGMAGLAWIVAGGVMYSIGAILYMIGKKCRFAHSVFHIFCLLGTFCHFLCIYCYVI